jgi:hypothetical protein
MYDTYQPRIAECDKELQRHGHQQFEAGKGPLRHSEARYASRDMRVQRSLVTLQLKWRRAISAC